MYFLRNCSSSKYVYPFLINLSSTLYFCLLHHITRYLSSTNFYYLLQPITKDLSSTNFFYLLHPITRDLFYLQNPIHTICIYYTPFLVILAVHTISIYYSSGLAKVIQKLSICGQIASKLKAILNTRQLLLKAFDH